MPKNDYAAGAIHGPRALKGATATNIAQFYHALPAMAVVLDERGIILALSRECAVQFSANAARAVGRSILSLAHRDDREAVSAALRAADMHRDRIVHCEFRIWRGSKPPLALHASLRAANRGPGATVLHAVCSDITDRVMLEQTLEKRSTELNELASELLVAQDRERRRIAHDMHDTVGHNLALAKFNVDCLMSAPPGETQRETMRCVRTLLQETIDAVRALTFALDSSPVQDRGLDAAIEDLGQTLSAGSTLQFSLSSRPRTRRLCEAARITLFRAVRELLVNAVKHAAATRVRVSIGADTTHLNIVVVDDGVGIDLDALPAAPGQGLRNLRRNVDRLDGELTIRNRDDRGTLVMLRVPYARIGETPDEDRRRSG